MIVKTVLITGGAGFVGSSLALLLKQKYPDYGIFCMDNLRRRGSELNLPRLKHAGIHFVHGDIRNKEDFNELPDANVIIDASAEPSVLAGINSSPDYVLNTNLVGTINCLNYGAKCKSDFIFLSTSRIYPIESLEKIKYSEVATRFEIAKTQDIVGVNENGISEVFPLNGARSFYGTSKLSSELLIQEYAVNYDFKSVINRCGVIAGPWQMGKIDQGVIVLWVAKHFWKKPLSYIGFGGTGKQVRDILHTNDLFTLVDWEMHNMNLVNKEIFNVGGGAKISVSLQELTKICEEVTGNKIPITTIAENRPADIPVYVTDNTKVTKFTGWKPTTYPQTIVQEIYHWIKDNQNNLESILK